LFFLRLQKKLGHSELVPRPAGSRSNDDGVPTLFPQRSHIALKRHRFFYRRRIPGSRLEVSLPLGTSDYREAQYLARMLDRKFVRLMASLSSMVDLQSVLRRELLRVIENDRQRHIATPAGQAVYAHAVEGWNVLAADLEQVDLDLADARRDLARRHTPGIEEWVDDVMAEFGIPQERRAELALGLAQVRIQGLEQSRRHLQFGITPEVSAQLPVSAPVPLASLEAPSEGPKLSDLLPGFIEFMTTESDWRPQTVLQNKNTYRMFEQVCGDLPVQSYKKRHLAQMYDLLRALPAMYGKAARWKSMTPMEIAESTKDEDLERLAMKTLKRHFAALGTFFTHLIKRGQYEGANPAHGFDFPMKGRANQKRKMWEGDKLKRLFESPVWTGCKSKASRGKPGTYVIKDDKYWLPLLGLYHGNRLEEFAQLAREDVRQEDDIIYLDINDEGTKQVKNDQSKRRVPIHPKLIELGFLEYVAAIAPAPGDAIFPQLSLGTFEKRGHSFSQWWTRYRRQIGLYEKALDYHSFRHGVTTKLYAADVSEPIIDELTGHEGQGTSRRVYKKDMPLRKLYEAIAKVEWPEVAI